MTTTEPGRAGITFDILFGLLTIGHFFVFALHRRWTSILFAIGSLSKLTIFFSPYYSFCDIIILFFSGRTFASPCPYNQTAFLLQITTLIIVPTFHSAALYVLLAVLINLLSTPSLLNPKFYAIIFCTCDILSLIIQTIGDGLASEATNQPDGDTDPGTHTMVAGIVFQLFTMTIFAVLVVGFLRRLAEGWQGNLITQEGYFIALDGALVFVASAVWLVFDPAVLLRGDEQPNKVEKEGQAAAEEVRERCKEEIGSFV
ncbi:RTA1 like protein-domain-containing protein [Podospora fimiseda]|uniref:RTA1 like protein-domain-containing protein n=1 Tax=Podospora fimiseda TaxID=252190 RepID=A0AAN7BNH6_9PEZI|nr:RTA1 like protein-domain-containing protein [Podospora fimiseda]